MPVNGSAAMSDALLQLADKLGYSVSKLYEVYTQGQAVEGMVMLGFIGFVLLTGVVASVLAYRFLSRFEGEVRRQTRVGSDECWDKDDILTYSVIAGLVAAFAAAMLGGIAYEAVLKVLAPEYMAAKELVQAAGGVVG